MWIEYYFNSNSNQAGTDVALDTSSFYWKETKYNLDSFRGKLYFRHRTDLKPLWLRNILLEPQEFYNSGAS